MNDVKYNKIARINVYGKSEEEYNNIRAEITKDIKDNKIKIYNTDMGCFGDYRGWGNYCLPNIPYEKALEYAEKFDLAIDLEKDIIQKEELLSLEVGQKIQYTIDSFFGMNTYKGTVYAKNEDSITVRLYRSKSKGHTLKVGNVGKIVSGW
ncbi:hypothetical protein [Paenibacillus tianjinensis]|uniref:Uncharacterized protein n=1 Tax=Paenibacillus tianjinensis TaxID=2810347 RepID=A0ABX7LBY2_9BACL|nr:hypothetical protein [Paenibacillus tianjinensis]QSF43502.1 hypothetical protein JRJ22_19765 [Paenibacillus tianjinensis]